MQTRQGKNVPISELKKETYLVQPEEAHLYHVRIERVRFDSKTGKRLSSPTIQMVGHRQFEQSTKRALESLGFTMDILHDPTEINLVAKD